MLQRTLKKAVSLTGVGVHRGNSASIKIRPALPNHGIHFIRTDIAESPLIPATHTAVVDTRMATTLGKNGVTISTVEHLMAALHGCGVDNALIEVHGPEIPILDGSSKGFCDAILEAGLQSQLQPKSFLAIRRRIEIQANGKWAYVEPSDRLRITSTIEWDHPVIGYQEYRYTEGQTSFRDIASARTFGFLRDVEAMQKAGLAKGGSLQNAIVLDDVRVLNPEGLRYSDEFVKHKVLDAIGDFKLCGFSILGEFRLHRSGHDLHSQLLSAIFSDKSNYEWVVGDAAGVEHQDRRLGRLRAALGRSRVAVTY